MLVFLAYSSIVIYDICVRLPPLKTLELLKQNSHLNMLA